MRSGNLTNSQRAGKIAYHLSKYLPPEIGYRLANFIARKLASNRQSPLVQGIRLNQWVVSNLSKAEEQLAHSVFCVMRNITTAFYEQFYFLHRTDKISSLIVDNQVFREITSWKKNNRGGLIVCGIHMSSFDLVFQAITMMGLKTIALTLPYETEAIAWQHQLRRQVGGEIVPATIPNLRQVIRRLQGGEIVVTGIDRPMDNLKWSPNFFGYPAQLPVHYIQLALAAKVPILLMASIRRQDGCFELFSSDYIHLQNHSDRKSEIVDNAERVLADAEEFIRMMPDQWTMFHPLWPELIPMLDDNVTRA